MAGKDPSKLTKAELVQLVKKQDGEVADKAAQLAASEAKATQLRNTLVRPACVHACSLARTCRQDLARATHSLGSSAPALGFRSVAVTPAAC